MRGKWLCLVALSAAAAGCGQGRAIFDIDVFSFLRATNADTLPYVGPLPPGIPDTIPVQTIRSLGIGSSSLVDTVRISGSVDFVNRITPPAEEMNHHPDVAISWNKVDLTLSTHSEGGLTENDFELATRIDSLA